MVEIHQVITKENSHVIDFFDGELADRAASDRVVRSCEDAVDELAVDDVAGRLDLVEVEWVRSWYRTVKPGLQKGCPRKIELME